MLLEHHTRTLLIVDDEPGVIEALRESLRDFGCRLITTTDPHHALSILHGNESLDLLITDLFMPAMDGARLVTEGRKVRPHLPAVLLTGLASTDEISRRRRRGEHVVAKPWTEEELTGVIERVLNLSRRPAHHDHAAH